MSETWFLLGTWVLCEVRLFALVLSGDENLGQELKIVKATIAMYIINAFLMTAVVAILNFVKLRDLAEDNMSDDEELCSRYTKKQVVFYVFKSVLASFWFQYFSYIFVVLFQIAFDVCEVEEKFAEETVLRALRVLKKTGQLAFMALISGYLWAKLFDDDKRIIGTKTDEGR